MARKKHNKNQTVFNFFSIGADLPLFSGTAQRVTQNPFQPTPVQTNMLPGLPPVTMADLAAHQKLNKSHR